MFVEDTDDYTKWDYGSEEFVLNVWDATVGDATDGTATVLWDEGHGQFYDLASFGEFEGYAESHGYDVRATADLEGNLPDADAAVITSPSESFSDSETRALENFLADGGGLFLHDQADYDDFDETATLEADARALVVTAPAETYTDAELDALASFRDDGGAVVLMNSGAPLPAARENLNAVAEALGTDLRANDDIVVDDVNNDNGDERVPTTSNFDGSFDLYSAYS